LKEDIGKVSSSKPSKIEQGEAPAQFAERLKRFLEKRRKMAGYEATCEGKDNI